MKFTTHKSQVRTIHQDDPNFRIVDGFTTYPRAGFHVLPECPRQYREIIELCVSNGWLKPIAHVTERELIFMGLSRQ